MDTKAQNDNGMIPYPLSIKEDHTVDTYKFRMWFYENLTLSMPGVQGKTNPIVILRIFK